MRKLTNALGYLNKFGARAFAREVFYQTADWLTDRRLGVQTRGYLTRPELGIHNDESAEYSTIWYTVLFRTMRSLPVQYEQSSFLDYGSGKGRMVIAAATFPFRRVLGVEISDRLLHEARRNVGAMRRKRAAAVELVSTDAAVFEVPPDVNVVYFYNPFAGQLLRRVVAKLQASYHRAPRKLHIVYFNDDHFEPIVRDAAWLRKTAQINVHPDIVCGVYESTG